MTKTLQHDHVSDVQQVIWATRAVEWAMKEGRVLDELAPDAQVTDINVEPAIEEDDPDFDVLISVENLGLENIEDEILALRCIAVALRNSLADNPYAESIAVRLVEEDTSIYPDSVLLVKVNPHDPSIGDRPSYGERRCEQDYLEGLAKDANGDPC